MNGVVKRKLPAKKAPPGKVLQRELAEANSHHRAGTMRIGIRLKIWCSCGWKWFGDLPASKEREVFEEHFSSG